MSRDVADHLVGSGLGCREGDRDRLAGVRPEDVRLAKSGDPFDHCLHTRVTAVEQLGSQRIAHVAFGSPDSGALDFTMRVTESRPLTVGDSIELTLAVDKITYFDRESGLRL